MANADPERAGRVFFQGANCAESVLAGLGLDGACPGAATGLGAGIARLGGTCGCLTGAALALGLRAGARDCRDEGTKDRVYAEIRALFDRFEETFGATRCRDLTGVDFLDPEDRQRFDRAAAERCREMVAWVVRELG